MPNQKKRPDPDKEALIRLLKRLLQRSGLTRFWPACRREVVVFHGQRLRIASPLGLSTCEIRLWGVNDGRLYLNCQGMMTLSGRWLSAPMAAAWPALALAPLFVYGV